MTDDDLAILAFAKIPWRYRGAREEEIRRRFGMSGWQFEQRLLQLCATPEALMVEPALVNRINRRRRAVS